VEAANAAAMLVFGYAALTPRALLAAATGLVVDRLADLAGPLLDPAEPRPGPS
jgi:hypothetical protein